MIRDDEKPLNPITLRPTVMEVKLDALERNFLAIKRFVVPAKVMPIVKANAYGHGLVRCAKLFQDSGAECFGVAFLEEGIELRQAGISVPILVIGGIFGTQIKYFLDYDLDLTASSVGKLAAIEETAAVVGKKARVHLKIDTGMERIGVHYYTAETLFERALQCSHCNVVGVFSHFATASNADFGFARLQLERFLECLHFFERRSLPMPDRHIALSGALLGMVESHLDMVRPGICLYGIYPSKELEDVLALEPVMSLRSHVVFVKIVKGGAGVSYGLTWKAEEDSRIATIPIGYGDGYSRGLSNRGVVLLRGKRYPIVGRVCMDQIMVNTGLDEAFVGDEVVLIGEQGEETITVNELAECARISPYEVLVNTNLRVPRRYYYKGMRVD